MPISSALQYMFIKQNGDIICSSESLNTHLMLQKVFFEINLINRESFDALGVSLVTIGERNE